MEHDRTLAGYLDALPDAVVAVAADGRIAFANREAEALLGEPLRGREAAPLLPGLDADRPRALLLARRADGTELPLDAAVRRHGALLLVSARRAENRDSLARLHSALESSPQPMLASPDGSIVDYANLAAERLFGRDRAALAGMPIDELVPGASRSSHAARDLTARRADGATLPVDVAVTLVETDAGSHAIYAVSDVSDRTRALRHLEEEARRRDVMVELGHEALTARNVDELFEHALQAVTDALGLDMVGVSEVAGDDLVLRRSHGWGIAPDAQPRMPAAGTQSGWTLAHGTTVIEDLAAETRFSTEALAAFGVTSGIAVPLIVEGRPVGVLSGFTRTRRAFGEHEAQFMRSVAIVLATAVARRRSEIALEASSARLRAVLEHAPMAVYLKDLDGRYLIANATTARVARLTVEEVLGRTDEELLPPEYAATMTNHDRLVLAAGEPLRFTERVWRPDGEEVYSSVKFPLRDHAGGVFGVGGISMDVTDQVRTESERARLEERVHRSQRLESVGQLAGGMAHDFNNLLAVIASYASFLVEDLPEGSRARDDASQIVAATERAADLTRRLLQFSRRQPSHPEVLDVGAIVGGIEPMMRRTLGEHIEVATDYGDQLWQVVADRGQLEQVLMNLALNARDAMAGGGRLTIAVRNEVAPPPSLNGGAFVRVTVSDSGAGMAPEVASRALEPFFTTKPAGHGTGLGLSSVYGIVAQAGGSLELDSAPGEGTRVTVWLPATTAEAAPARDERAPAPAGGGERVLVVEDQEGVREVTRRILTDGGYDVTCVADPVEAEGIALGAPPDVLVADVLMPGLSGAELVARVRDRLPELPVVFVSGFAEESRTAASEGAPTLFVEKPFRAADLLTAVARALHGAR